MKFKIIFICFLFVVSFVEVTTFLLEDKTPLPNNDLTDKHYIAVVDLLLEEKKARQQLEIAVTQLHHELLTKTSHLTTLNDANNLTEKCKADLQAMKNYTDNIQGELTAEIKLLKQNLSKLQLENNDIKIRLKTSENRSIEESKKVQNDLNSLKQLKAIDQLQDVHSLRTQFETIQRQVQQLSSVQSARGQDFLALYNQTLGIKTSLTQSMTDLSNNHNDSMMQVLAVHMKDNLTIHEMKKELGNELSRLKQQITDENLSRGTTYVRWSRKQCPGNKTELLYSGYAGGGYYSATGSSAEPVCLPPDPDLVKSISGSRGHMYGAEFDGSGKFALNSHAQDVPCAVCRVKQTSSVIMIPGKNRCYTGWSIEYHGYLASNYESHPAAGSYVCIDIQPEYVDGGASWNGRSKLFYEVAAECGSLHCPPYKQNYQLPCVVCSK